MWRPKMADEEQMSDLDRGAEADQEAVDEAVRERLYPRQPQPVSGAEQGGGAAAKGPDTGPRERRGVAFQTQEDIVFLGAKPVDNPAVQVLGVRKRLGGRWVLDGVTLELPDDTITVVLGPSGTGKSVLIKHIIGLMFPDEGRIIVRGKDVGQLPLPELLELRQRIGMLFQDGALFGSMSLYDNIAFPLRQHTDRSEVEIAQIVRERLTDVGLARYEDLYPSELSGGMRKRAGFARALAMEPDIVIFDEPDSGLDPVRTALLCELIKRMHATYGGAYMVVTHDIASARRIGEYIAILWRGKIVQAGTAEEMFASDHPFVRQFLRGSARGPLGMD